MPSPRPRKLQNIGLDIKEFDERRWGEMVPVFKRSSVEKTVNKVTQSVRQAETAFLSRYFGRCKYTFGFTCHGVVNLPLLVFQKEDENNSICSDLRSN